MALELFRCIPKCGPPPPQRIPVLVGYSNSKVAACSPPKVGEGSSNLLCGRHPPVSYLVGTPKGRLSKLEKALLGPPWQTVRHGVEVKLLPQEQELYVLARSAPPVRSVSVGAERSMVAPANECLSKVIFFGDRSSHRMTKSHTERNHQGKSTISLLRQIADTRCEEAARSRERRGEPLRCYQQDAA
jgi:hypothetical protein